MSDPKSIKVDDLIRDHGAEVLKFTRYWKYSFTYSGGGISMDGHSEGSDIYRTEVTAEPQTLEYLIHDWSPDEVNIKGETFDIDYSAWKDLNHG